MLEMGHGLQEGLFGYLEFTCEDAGAARRIDTIHIIFLFRISAFIIAITHATTNLPGLVLNDTQRERERESTSNKL